MTPFVSIQIDGWQKAPKPDGYDESGAFQWDQVMGLFKNTPEGAADHIVNCNGAQAAYIFAIPQAGLFQDYESADGAHTQPSQALDVRFEVGNSYRLQVGVIGGGGNMTEEARLALSLYYRDLLGQRVAVATAWVTNDLERFRGRTNFIDFEVRVPAVKPDAPWAGRYLGVEIASVVSDEKQGGYWDVDNVQLSVVTDPTFALSYEPTGSDLRISWPSEVGRVYQLKVSEDFQAWSDYSPSVAGTGGELVQIARLTERTAALFRVESISVP